MTAKPNETPPEDLLQAAWAVWENAYVPYSTYRVGAALRSESGTVYQGANIENASYGLGRCAEQSAIQAMASAGDRGFTEIVVVTDDTPPASPCGACRQVLHEFGPQATVFMVNREGVVRVASVEELLPLGFSLG